MNKNYVENSLKRFLKRKVKITTGFVVAFLITGTVGFAESLTGEHTFDKDITIESDKTVGGKLSGIYSDKDNPKVNIVGENSKITIHTENKGSAISGIYTDHGTADNRTNVNITADLIAIDSISTDGNGAFGIFLQRYNDTTINGDISINAITDTNGKNSHGVLPSGFISKGIATLTGENFDLYSKSINGSDYINGTLGMQISSDLNTSEEKAHTTFNYKNMKVTSEGYGNGTVETIRVLDNGKATFNNDVTTIEAKSNRCAQALGVNGNGKIEFLKGNVFIKSEVVDTPEGMPDPDLFYLASGIAMNGNKDSNITFGKEVENVDIKVSSVAEETVGVQVNSGFLDVKSERFVVDVSSKKGGAFGIATAKGGIIDITSNDISITTTSTEGNSTAVEANNGTGAGGEAVKLGGENTENIVLKATGKEFATGIEVVNHPPKQGEKTAGSKVEVKSKNLVIDVHSTNQEAAGIWVQNSTQGEGSEDKIAKVIVDSENTVINVTSDTKGKALGLVNLSQGILEVNGNLEVNADTVLDTRGKAVTVINKDGKNTVKLNGDIVFDYDDKTSKTTIDADVTINLSNSESYFNGNIGTASDINPIPDDKKDVLGMKLGLSNGAQWTTDANSFVNKLTLDDGIININGGKDHTVKVDEVLGKGGTVNIDTKVAGTGLEAGKLEIKDVKENNKTALDVNFTGITADDVTTEKFEELAKDSITGNGLSKLDTTVKVEEGLTNGAITGELGENGVNNLVQNSSTSTIDGLQALTTNTYIAWKQEMNSLNKRMGDLRNSTGDEGVWYRVYAGESEYNKGYKNEYQTYQVGYDKKYSTPNGTGFVGYLVSYTNGDTKYNHNSYGSGENTSVGGGIYGIWLGNCGSYVDLIFKVSRLENEYDVTSKGGIKSSGDYNTFGMSLSAEYGKRFDLTKGLFLEPSVEMSLGRIGSQDYRTSSGLDIEQDTIYTAEGKVGTVLGYNFDRGNVYLRIAGVKEFEGELDTTIDGKSVSEDLGDSWIEYGVGANYRVLENLNIYADLEKTGSAEVETNWQANLGFRYEF